MGFLSGVFGGGKKPDVRQTTDDQLNKIMAPIREQVADFKERTKVSNTHIIPAINSVGVKLLVKSRGLESAQRLYRNIINDADSKGGIPVGSHMGLDKPPVAPEDIAELNDILWKNANNMIGGGTPLEHVAQAYTAFAMTIAESAAKGDPWLVKLLLADAARELKIDFKTLDAAQAIHSDQSSAQIECPSDTPDYLKTLFNAYRDFIYQFRDKSGLDWEHLLPGIQLGATVYFIKDRGKARTLELFEERLAALMRDMPPRPKEFPPGPITPLHVTNMAKFNEVILDMSERLMREAECPPGLIGHALFLLVATISFTHFDSIRCAATVATACQEIKKGAFDEF